MKKLLLTRRVGVIPLLLVALLSPSLMAQTLTVQEGLSLWLKADAGVVVEAGGGVIGWEDQSGQDNHAFVTQPEAAPERVTGALHNLPVLRFDGVDDYLEIPDADSISQEGDLTSFFVVKFDDFATYRAVWGKTAVNYPAPTDYYTLPNTGVPRLLRGDGTAANLGTVDGSFALRPNTYLIAGFDVNGTTATHYLGAQANGGGEITAFTMDNDTALIIGSREDLFTKMKGDIAEILLYNRALSPAERESVVAYLGAKFAIQNLPPVISLTAAPAGQVVTLTATATDPDGTVARVEFLANGALLATAVAPPYTVAVRLDTPGAYTFAARAVDEDDGFADAASVTLTVSGNAAPELAVRHDLSLWLKADAGITTGDANTVQSWNDQSGQENHALPRDEFTAPALVADGGRGLPVVRFDGVDDLLEVAHSESLDLTEGFTTFFVVQMDDFATYRAVWAKTTSNMPAPVDFYGLPGSGVLRFYTGDGTTVSSMDGLRPLLAGVTQIVGVSRVGNQVAQHLNGLPNGSGTATAPAVDLGLPLTIGSRDDFVTQLQGDLSELLIYQGGLSAQEEQEVQSYLAARHRIPLVSLANAAPTATLTTPAAGATFAAPAEIALAATAADTDGSVVRVEFLVNGTTVATDTTAPYEASVELTVPGAQELAVRAVDNLGASQVSASVTITITSETAPPLPAFSQLSLWLRADKDVSVEGGVASMWLDQSGKLNHAVQTNTSKRPQWVEDQLNGKPVLRFDGVDDDLTAPSTASLAHTGPLSSFFVVRFDDFATYRAVWGKTAAHLPRATDYYLMPDSGVPRLFRGGVGANGFLDAGFGVEPGEFVILGFEHDGNIARHYYNGEISAEGIINVTLEDTGDPLTIGSRSDGVTRLAGDLAELVIYNRVLNDAERAQVLDYLADKYDILVTYAVTDAPVLNFTVSGAQITLSWPPVNGWTLQESPSLEADSWTDVPNVIGNTVTLPLSGAGFYRLARY